MRESPAVQAGVAAACESIGDVGLSGGGLAADPWMRGGGRRYCCRCLMDKPLKGGRHRGPLFTCADCRALFEKPE
jgi:hypothetical protein